MRTFLGEEHRDAQARLLDAIALQHVGCLHGIVRVQSVLQGFLRPRVGAHETPESPGPVFNDYLFSLVGQRNLVARALVERPTEFGQQLPGFLFRRHLAQQVVHALLNRLLRVFVDILLLILVEVYPTLFVYIRRLVACRSDGCKSEEGTCQNSYHFHIVFFRFRLFEGAKDTEKVWNRR